MRDCLKNLIRVYNAKMSYMRKRFDCLCSNKKLVTCSQTRKTDESVEQFVTTFVARDFPKNFLLVIVSLKQICKKIPYLCHIKTIYGYQCQYININTFVATDHLKNFVSVMLSLKQICKEYYQIPSKEDMIINTDLSMFQYQ